MAEIETYPPRYYDYLASQHRVSNWVQQTYSDPLNKISISSRNPPRALIRRSKADAESMSALSSSLPAPRHRLTVKKSKSLRRSTHLVHNSANQAPIPPAAALITSSIFVYAFLPSLLTVIAFAVVLTLVTMCTEESNDQKSKIHEVGDATS